MSSTWEQLSILQFPASSQEENHVDNDQVNCVPIDFSILQNGQDQNPESGNTCFV